MTVVINLALATICFFSNNQRECHPILYGKSTPRGEFQIILRKTQQIGYGGDVLKFTETSEVVLAIHRIWLLNPSQKREQRLLSPSIDDHIITSGCINVDVETYNKLRDCCSHDTLTIE